MWRGRRPGGGDRGIWLDRIADVEAESEAAGRRGHSAAEITGRALLVGTITVAAVSVITLFLGAVTHTWDPGGSALPATAVVVLFFLVLMNGALARLSPRLTLSRVELLVTYAMVIMVAQFLYKGGMPFITGATTFPFYMATPGNDWERRVWPHIPTWLALGDQNANTWYWEGLPPGRGVPWGAWALPMLGWASFSMAAMGAMFCLSALLNRDWIERQRLAFPLVDIPLAITGDEPRPALGTSIFQNPIAWIGFSIPAAFALMDWLHQLYPSIPQTPMEYDVGRALSGMGLPWNVLSGDSGIHFSLVFAYVGIAYLLPGEVSLSLWLFYALYRFQQLVWASFGISQEGGGGVTINPQTFIGMEEAGGFIALSAMVLYQSRRTLLAAGRGIFLRSARRSETESGFGLHWALIGLIVANAFMMWWALQTGMAWWPFVLIMGLFYTVMIGVTRLVAAAGTTHVDTGLFPRQVIMNTIGANAVGPVSLTMFSYLSSIYMYDPRIVLMAQSMNGFKLLHTSRIRERRFPWAWALAVVTMLGVGFPLMVWIANHYGALTLPDWPVASPARGVFSELDSSLRSPEAPDNWLRGALGIGAVFMGAMIFMHSRFIWWPVSPVGFLIASGWSTDRFVWSNALIGWAVGTLVRRYGGLKLYRTLRPAFLGMVIGGYIPGGVFAVVSTIFGIRQPE